MDAGRVGAGGMARSGGLTGGEGGRSGASHPLRHSREGENPVSAVTQSRVATTAPSALDSRMRGNDEGMRCSGLLTLISFLFEPGCPASSITRQLRDFFDGVQGQPRPISRCHPGCHDRLVFPDCSHCALLSMPCVKRSDPASSQEAIALFGRAECATREVVSFQDDAIAGHHRAPRSPFPMVPLAISSILSRLFFAASRKDSSISMRGCRSRKAM